MKALSSDSAENTTPTEQLIFHHFLFSDYNNLKCMSVMIKSFYPT